jgi:hypothetical protein
MAENLDEFLDGPEHDGRSHAGVPGIPTPGVEAVGTVFVPVVTSGAGVQDLMSIVIPAGKLAVDGELLEVDCWGSCGILVSTVTYAPDFGSSTLFTRGFAVAGLTTVLWHLKMIVLRTGALTQSIQTRLSHSDLSGGNEVFEFAENLLAEDWAAPITVKMRGGPSSGAVVMTQRYMRADKRFL